MTNMFQGGAGAEQLLGLVLIGIISFLTVGGKAAGKTYALQRPTDVVVLAGRIISGLERMTGRSFTGGRGPNSSRRRTT